MHLDRHRVALLSIVCTLTFGLSIPNSWALPPLTIDVAVQEAIARNPDLRAARENVAQQEATKDYVKAQFFPTINGVATGAIIKNASNNTSSSFGGEPYNLYTAGLQLSQPLTFYPGAAAPAGLAYAKKSIEIAKYSLDIAERDVTVAVIQAFYTVLLNKRLYEILKEAEATQRQSVATQKRYQRIGRSELLDVLQADTQLALLAPQITQAENAMKIAAAQLATLLRQTGADEIEVTGQLEPVMSPALQERLKGPRQLVNEVLRSRTLLAQFEDTRDITLAAHYPTLNLAATLMQNAYVKTQLLDPYANSWSVQATLTVPIFSGLSSLASRRQLSAQGAILQANDDKLLDSTSLSLIQAQKNLATASQVLETSRLAAQLADASMKEAQRKFRLNTIDPLKLLTSEQSQLTAQSSFMQARYNYIQAVTQYFVSAGLPIGDLVKFLSVRSDT